MKVDLFSVPLLIGDIDCKKIKVKNEKFISKWESVSKTSFGQKNLMTRDSLNYLLNTISDLVKETVDKNFILEMVDFWENHYEKNDYQESHIHAGCDLSFIIYKKINKSKTVFIHPVKNLIQSFYPKGGFLNTEYKTSFKKNTIIVFPSFLEHCVLKHTSKAITLAGNLKLHIK